MSESGSFWINMAEKFFGLILVVIGGVLVYFTATSAALGSFMALFAFLSIVVVVAGAFLIIVRPPD